MRTIKFRFWDVRDKEIIPWENINTEHLHYYLSLDENIVIPMQFTGLQDKNGEEIYEGDILTLPNMGKGTIEWYHCGFILRLQSEIIWQELLFNVVGHYTIIGNIYQNPELIKQK